MGSIIDFDMYFTKTKKLFTKINLNFFNPNAWLENIRPNLSYARDAANYLFQSFAFPAAFALPAVLTVFWFRA